MTAGALDGLRVLDLSNQLSGPYCAMLLGDLGADVIKVEHPVGGDPARLGAPHRGGESAPFMTVNRNKRSITVDLKTPDGLAIARRLAARADVVLENWRPGAAARLGLGYDDVRRLNPRVVYCSISGFGQTGPYASRGGFDRIAQGMSGLMSINGDADGPPLVVPIPIADIGTGMFGLVGILAARADRGLAREARSGWRARGTDPDLRSGVRRSSSEGTRDGGRGEPPDGGPDPRAGRPRQALEDARRRAPPGADARAAHRRGPRRARLRRDGDHRPPHPPGRLVPRRTHRGSSAGFARAIGPGGRQGATRGIRRRGSRG